MPSDQVRISLLPVQPCSAAELQMFLALLSSSSVDKHTLGLFKSLASMGYRQRYALNISHFMDCFADHRIDNVAREGLTEFEQRALAQLTGLGLTSSQLRIAHLLLGVPDRYELLQFLKETLPRIRVRHAAGDSPE